MAETATATASKSAHRNNHMGMIIFVGIGMIVLFLIVFVSQVQTTEAWVQHQGAVDVFHPNWSIVWQIPALVIGQLPSSEAQAAIVGWGVELVYLAFIVGYEILKEAVHTTSGQLMAKVCRSLGFVVIAFCGYTDYQYGTIGTGIVGHLTFAVVCSIVIAYFGTIGWAFIRHGWQRA